MKEITVTVGVTFHGIYPYTPEGYAEALRRKGLLGTSAYMYVQEELTENPFEKKD